MLQWVYIEGKPFQKSKYTDFIIKMDLSRKFTETGYRSPKTFVKERYNHEWIAHQVIKRLEGG